MTTQALSGEISKIGKSGRNYTFGFGWSCRYNLEQMYTDGIKGVINENDFAAIVSNTLFAALLARSSNQIQPDISKKELYELLDDIGEAGVAEVWEVAKQSMGFMDRLLGLSPQDIEQLTEAALKNQNPPTGKPS